MPRLREIRVDQLLSIRALAQEAHVSPSTIYHIEAGRTTPRVAVIRRLAAALRVPPGTVEEFRRAMEAAMRPRPRGARGGLRP